MHEGGVRRGGSGWDVGWVVGPRAEPSRLAPRPSPSRLVSGAGGLGTSGSGVAGSGVGSSDVRSLGSSSSSSSALPPPPAPAPLRPACRTSCRPHQPTSKGTTRDDGGQRARGLREHERASNARASHTMRRARAYGERRTRGAGRGCRATCKVHRVQGSMQRRGGMAWAGCAPASKEGRVAKGRVRPHHRACAQWARHRSPALHKMQTWGRTMRAVVGQCEARVGRAHEHAWETRLPRGGCSSRSARHLAKKRVSAKSATFWLPRAVDAFKWRLKSRKPGFCISDANTDFRPLY